jgi:hypothetical protein
MTCFARNDSSVIVAGRGSCAGKGSLEMRTAKSLVAAFQRKSVHPFLPAQPCTKVPHFVWWI